MAPRDWRRDLLLINHPLSTTVVSLAGPRIWTCCFGYFKGIARFCHVLRRATPWHPKGSSLGYLKSKLRNWVRNLCSAAWRNAGPTRLPKSARFSPHSWGCRSLSQDLLVGSSPGLVANSIWLTNSLARSALMRFAGICRALSLACVAATALTTVLSLRSLRGTAMVIGLVPNCLNSPTFCRKFWAASWSPRTSTSGGSWPSRSADGCGKGRATSSSSGPFSAEWTPCWTSWPPFAPCSPLLVDQVLSVSWVSPVLAIQFPALCQDPSQPSGTSPLHRSVHRSSRTASNPQWADPCSRCRESSSPRNQEVRRISSILILSDPRTTKSSSDALDVDVGDLFQHSSWRMQSLISSDIKAFVCGFPSGPNSSGIGILLISSIKMSFNIGAYAAVDLDNLNAASGSSGHAPLCKVSRNPWSCFTIGIPVHKHVGFLLASMHLGLRSHVANPSAAPGSISLQATLWSSGIRSHPSCTPWGPQASQSKTP